MTVTWLKTLFPEPYNESDPYWIIQACFNLIYNDCNFVQAIESISEKIGAGTDGAVCYFPDMNSYYEEDHFEGVMFSWGYNEDTIIVSEEVCFHYVRLASELYLQKHPEDTEKVNQILANIPE